MGTKSLIKFSLLIFFIPCLINCLYEDQAGTYDWRQQYVGKPLYSKIDTTFNRVYIASEQNVLASLNLKTGNFVWRKVFENNENGQIDLVVWGNKEIVLTTGNGQRVQAFGYNHGFANWEYNLFSPDPAKRSNIVGIESRQESESFYLTNGYQLCLVSSREKACVDLPSDGGFVYKNLIETEQGLFLIGFKDNLAQKLHYNSLLTSLLSKSISNEQENFKYSNCFHSTNFNQLSCFNSLNGLLLNFEVKPGNKFELNKLLIQKSILNQDDQTDLLWSSKDFYLVEGVKKVNDFDSTRNLYLFKQQQNENELVLLKKFESISSFDLVYKESNTYLVYSSYSGKNKLNFNVVDLRTVQERADLLVSVSLPQSDDKKIEQMRVQFGESKNSQLLMTIMLFFNDYSMSVFNNQGVKLFTREEALAYIVNVEMVDFPLLHLQEEFEDEFGSSQQDNILNMFYKRIRTQLVQLKEFVQIDLAQKLSTLLNNNPAKRSTSTAPGSVEEIIRDEFNLNKIIVAVTSVGKVFGLYTSANGRILWSFYLKDIIPFKLNNLNNDMSIPLFIQRTAAHVPYEPQCALVAKTKLNNQVKTRIYFFNPLNGQASKDLPQNGFVYDYEIKQAFLSNIVNNHFLKPLLLFDTKNRLHVYPESSVDELKLKSANKQSIVFSAELDNDKLNTIVGYSVKFSSEPLIEVFRVNFEDEKIISIASKLHNDRIHSHGKVLGDRSVLYKYLNPNLIGVVTSGQDSQKVPFINIYLVDTVTGSIVNSFNHKRCKGPVHIIHSENWFFYSYYNTKYRRYEVSSVELFEGSTQFNSTHFSSLDDIKPVVYTKSYIVQRSFDAMQLTVTEKGISTKDIIVACQYGLIIEIPWILIDPRRPIKMTEVEREENLIPYMPEIPLNYEFTLNYYNYVYNIRGITTAPSGLESTSLVFTYGLDIFFTRVFPSKTFDMLREDFDYFFITTLMVGLILGTLLSKKLASSSNLKKAWK